MICVLRFFFSRLFLLACALLLAACGDEQGATGYQPQYGDRPVADTNGRKAYVFGIHPLHNPARLFQVYDPIMDRLNAAIPDAHFSLEASRNYEEFDRKLYARHFDLALPNPYQTVNSLAHGYRVFGKMGDDDQFRGIILVRKDGPVRQVSDLKGKILSFPALTALAATMMPQQFLHERGLPLKDYQANYVGSQESSIMNVYLGNSAAGATWPPPWQAFEKDHPEYSDQLKIMWSTEALPNNGLVARDDFPPQLLKKVSDVLFTLQDSEAGRAILASLPLSRFEAANGETYQPVRDFVAHFSATVRPLEAP